MMTELRGHPPPSIADRAVRERRDYATGLRVHEGGANSRLALPASNVLSYLLEGGTRIVIRPSGTEPKLKYYIDHREPVSHEESLAGAKERAGQAVDAVDYAVKALLERAGSS